MCGNGSDRKGGVVNGTACERGRVTSSGTAGASRVSKIVVGKVLLTVTIRQISTSIAQAVVV